MVAGCLCNPCQQPILWDRAHVLGVPLFPQGQYLLPREKTQATLWLTANPFGDIPLFPNRAHCTVSDGAVVPTVTARDKDPRLGQGSPKDGNSRTHCKCCWPQSAQRRVGHCAHRGGGLCSLPFLPVLEGCSNLRSPHAARGREMLRRHFTTPRYPLCSLSLPSPCLLLGLHKLRGGKNKTLKALQSLQTSSDPHTTRNVPGGARTP